MPTLVTWRLPLMRRKPSHRWPPVTVRAIVRPRYPLSRHLSLIGHLHARLVHDSYRWLASGNSEDTGGARCGGAVAFLAYVNGPMIKMIKE